MVFWVLADLFNTVARQMGSTMSTQDRLADSLQKPPESTMSPGHPVRNLLHMPPEVMKNILKHFRNEKGVIGRDARALIRTLRTVKGPDGKVHPLYEAVVAEVYATSLTPLMFYHFKEIPHHSNPKNRFVNLVIPIGMPCIIGVPEALCPSPHISHIRICLYGMRAETDIKKIVHTWITSLGHVEMLELQTYGVYERTARSARVDDEYHDTVVVPEGSAAAQTFFALYEYDMCTVDDMLGVEGKRSDGYGTLRENYTCVWQVARGERLVSLGENYVPERTRMVYYALEPQRPSLGMAVAAVNT